jgi:hypothetical protein
MGRTRIALLVIVVLGAAGLVGSGGASPVATAAEPADRETISHTGLATIDLGTSRTELVRDHGLDQDEGGCAPRLPAYPSASPVFEAGRLVLLWAHPPLHTPGGLAVDSPVDAVRAAHPDAEELIAEPGSHRFDALLVVVDDRAYLFLHDQQRVRKLVVGYAGPAQRLFHDGFGAC